MKRLLCAVSAVIALALAALVSPASASTVPVVSLGVSFSPSSVVLHVGESLVVSVNNDVVATVTRPPSGGPVTGGALGPSAYMYLAVRPGTTTLTAFVAPRCFPGRPCLQWRATPRLTITVLRHLRRRGPQ